MVSDGHDAPGSDRDTWRGRALRGARLSALVVACMLAAATFAAMTDFLPVLTTHDGVVGVLIADAIAIAVLIAILGRELAPLVRGRRDPAIRKRLQAATLFLVAAGASAAAVALTAEATIAASLNLVVLPDYENLVQNSDRVVIAHTTGEVSALRNDIRLISDRVTAARAQFDNDRPAFHQLLNAQSTDRHVPIVMLVKADGSIVDRAASNDGAGASSLPAGLVLASVTDAAPQIVSPTHGMIAAVVKLRGYDDSYLYVGRAIDPGVIAGIDAAQSLHTVYDIMRERRATVEVAFGLMFTAIALIALLVAVCVGLRRMNRVLATMPPPAGAAPA